MIENSHQTVGPFASGFRGFEYMSEQELIKDTLNLKKSIQYLTKDYALKRVIASFEFLTERESLIASERDLILQSLTVH